MPVSLSFLRPPCPDSFQLDADRAGTVCINGKQAPENLAFIAGAPFCASG